MIAVRASPPSRSRVLAWRAASVVSAMAVVGLVVSRVAGPQRLRSAEEKHGHHSSSSSPPPPPPFPFATSGFAFGGPSPSRRCLEQLISSCPSTHPREVESWLTWKKCCPDPPPPGVCYHSDQCFHECADGYEHVATSFWAWTCDDLCCTAGQPGPFWYDRCWVECLAGWQKSCLCPFSRCMELSHLWRVACFQPLWCVACFPCVGRPGDRAKRAFERMGRNAHNWATFSGPGIRKSAFCWDLCVPIGQSYEAWELTPSPVSDKMVTQVGHHALGGGTMATVVG